MARDYKDFDFRYAPPPIPDRQFDWAATHDDYDGEDTDDAPLFFGTTEQEVKEKVDNWYAEKEREKEVILEQNAPAAPEGQKRLYWVATYGKMGLEVSHAYDRKEHSDAVEEAREQHDSGDVDSYTYGWEDHDA